MAHESVSDDPPKSQTTETTVLFVDDDSDLLDVYEAIYGKEYDVLTASSGREALETISNEIDIAFLDRRMPDMSGGKVLETIRAKGYEIPVVILSAVDADVTIDAAYDEYLSKPTGKDQVCAVIEEQTD